MTEPRDAVIWAKLRILSEAWRVPVVVSPSLLAFGLVCVVSSGDGASKVLHWVGLLTQVFGMGIVANDLIGRLTEYGMPTPRQRVVLWFRRLTGTLPRVAGKANAEFPSMTSTMTGESDFIVNGGTLEDRVARLEARAQQDRKVFQEHRRKTVTEFQKVDARIDQGLAEHNDLKASVERQFRQRAVGGADREWMGWVLALQGTLIGGVSQFGPWLFRLLS